jgi:ATP-dependent exoDNAse (exonuclease V) beta subunit
MSNNNVVTKIANRISEIDEESKQINFLDQRFYQRKDKYYPSITSILQCYPKGKYFDQWLKDVGNSAEHIAARSAQEGTLTHELIEKYLKGEKLEWLNENGNANYPLNVWKMVLRFAEFWETYKPILIHSEIHLFSDINEIAGTCDLVLEINGEIWLLDIKTSNHLNNSYDLQTAAYTICWNETFEEKVKRNGIIWLKSNKHKPDSKGEKMQGKGWEIRESDRSIEENWALFTHVHALYKIENPKAKPVFNSFPLSIQVK